jgi:hypothetical protein
MNYNLLNTKTIVPRANVRAFEKELFKCGFGYPLNLELSTYPRYKKGSKMNIAFIINANGEIEDYEYDNDFMPYERSTAEEINWEFYFD